VTKKASGSYFDSLSWSELLVRKTNQTVNNSSTRNNEDFNTAEEAAHAYDLAARFLGRKTNLLFIVFYRGHKP
jgi:hypothetical protein